MRRLASTIPARLRATVFLGVAAALATACGTTVSLNAAGKAVNGTSSLSAGSLANSGAPGANSGVVSPNGTTAPGAPGSNAGFSQPGGASASVGAGTGSSPLQAVAPNAPMRIGFLAVDLNKVGASMGISNSSDPLQGFKDMVAYLNHHGGLAGHPIKPDYYTIDGTTTDMISAAQAACTHFTQDQHDQAVVSAATFGPTINACLAAAHVPNFDAAQWGLDGSGQRQYPGYIPATGLGEDRYSAALIEAAVANKWLTSKDKLGVLSSSCPWDNRTYDSVEKSLAQRYGFQIYLEQTDCNENGVSGIGQVQSQIQADEVKFRSAGVTVVTFLSEWEGSYASAFAQDAEQQHWHPYYLLTSESQPAALVQSQGSALSFPKADLPQIRGIGWQPVTDIGTSVPIGSAAQRAQRTACLAMSPSAGGSREQSDPGIRALLLEGFLDQCDTLLAVRAIVSADGGRLDLSAVAGVFGRAVASLVSTSDLGGSFHASSDRFDAAPAASPWIYDGKCSCIRYTASPRAVP